MAIKIAHQSLFNDPVNGSRFRKMFMNEASLAGRLRHPHIVAVYDAGSERDMHYIVMEYVAGQTLKTHCQPDNLLPVNDVLEIIFKCCNALDYACTRGLIHRDLKPANLLITGESGVKISDFGTALMKDSELTQIVDAVGTPSYMAPEHLAGKSLTHRADIYSLGVVMYQLLSGRLPFSADNQYELIRKISTQPPTPLKSVRADLPLGVLNIVERCLQKEPENRYQNWGEMAYDLGRLHDKLSLERTDSSDTLKFNILKTLDFFSGFSDVELWEVIRISQWRRFRGGSKLLEQGKIGGSLFVLASGEARIIRDDAELGKIHSGQCFGEMAYISGVKKHRSASVVSDSNTTVIKIKSEALNRASDPVQKKFNQVLMRTLAERLEKTSAIASSL